MSEAAPGGVLLDLFGTLVLFDEERLPAGPVTGQRMRSTIPLLLPLLAQVAPEVRADAFIAGLRTATDALVKARRRDHQERPSRWRFTHALMLAGCTAGHIDAAALVLSRRHLRAIADATVFPASHAAMLAMLAARTRVAVVSNFDDTSTAFAILHRHGILPQVTTVVVSEAVGVRKPHPQLVDTALRELDVAASAAWLVGDTFGEDVQAAQAAGVRAVWIDARAAGTPAGAVAPWRVIGALPELAALFD